MFLLKNCQNYYHPKEGMIYNILINKFFKTLHYIKSQ